MGKFVIKKTSKGFTVSLKAGNNAIIAVGGEVLSSAATAKKSIESIKKCSAKAPIEDQTIADFAKQKFPKFEVYTDKKGEFRFRLLASNGEPIAASEGYKSKQSCLNGIESVRKNAADSEIVETE